MEVNLKARARASRPADSARQSSSGIRAEYSLPGARPGLQQSSPTPHCKCGTGTAVRRLHCGERV